MAEAYEFKMSSPEKQGIDSKGILNFIKDMEKQELELHSFMMIRNGHKVSSCWWSPYKEDEPHMLFSLSKSFTSTAVGLAIEEGLFTLDDHVLSYFTEDVPEEISENLKAMTVRDLLTMTAGHGDDPMWRIIKREDGNWAKGFLAEEVAFKPGTKFLYNTMATYMLSAILQKTAGMTLFDYLQPRILQPLGIEGTWGTCPKGITEGGWGLSTTTESIAKFGQLYLQKGNWEGKQLVPEYWVEEATKYHIDNSEERVGDWAQGYGYQFWRCSHNAYRGDGAFGQFCLVMPDKETVIAITSGLKDMQKVMDSIWTYIYPAINEEALVADDNLDELRAYESSRSYTVEGETVTSLTSQLDGSTYKMEPNELGIQDITFLCEDDYIVMSHNTVMGRKNYRISYTEWTEGRMDTPMQPQVKIRAMAKWHGDKTMELVIRFVETPFALSLLHHFEQEKLRIEINQNVSFLPSEAKPMLGQLVKVEEEIS